MKKTTWAGLVMLAAVAALGEPASPESRPTPPTAPSLAELKQRFRRPAAIPHPADNALTAARIALGEALFSTRACRPRATCRARRATTRTAPGATAGPAPSAPAVISCGGARRRSSTSPGPSCCSGTAGPTAWRDRRCSRCSLRWR